MATNGTIRDRAKAKQLISFHNLVWEGKYCPTDFDFIYEWKDRWLIIGEFKQAGNDIPIGQRLALERVCKNTIAAGKGSSVFLAWHFNADPDDDIDAGGCFVKAVFDGIRWEEPKKATTVRALMDSYMDGYKGPAGTPVKDPFRAPAADDDGWTVQ